MRWKGPSTEQKKQLQCFALGCVLTAAGFLWHKRISRAEVFFDPLNDPNILQCTHVMHLEMPVPKERWDFVREAFRFCKPKSGFHHYPCRCGIVKP